MKVLQFCQKTARSFQIVAPLDNEIAAMEGLQVDIQSFDESFAIVRKQQYRFK
jgi:hypothetical protein